jgi:hypothetical protein
MTAHSWPAPARALTDDWTGALRELVTAADLAARDLSHPNQICAREEQVQMHDAQIGRMVRMHMAAAGLGNKQLAGLCDVDVKTIQRLLKGNFSQRTLYKVKPILGLKLDGESESDYVAAATYGAYSKAQYADYLGSYLCCRRSFSSRENIAVSHLTIDWPKERKSLCFRIRRILDTSLASGIDTLVSTEKARSS